MSKSKDKSPRFEDAVEQLEQLIERIESGQVGLEECLSHYEKGMKLIAHCRTILTAAEQKITELTVDADGKLASLVGEDDADVIPEDDEADKTDEE